MSGYGSRYSYNHGGSSGSSGNSTHNSTSKKKRNSWSHSHSSTSSPGGVSARRHDEAEVKDGQVERTGLGLLSGRELLTKLSRFLDKPQKAFVWWKNADDKCCGGHRVWYSATKALVRAADGTFVIRLREELLDEPPRDVTGEDATTIIHRLDFLLRDFEVKAEIEDQQSGWGWGHKTVVLEVTVTRPGLPASGFERIGVRKQNNKLVWVNVSALRSVTIGGDASAVDASLRGELAQLQSKLEEADILQTTLRKDVEEAKGGKNEARSQLGMANRKVEQLANENRTSKSRIRDLEQEKSRLLTSIRGVKTELSSLKSKVVTLERTSEAEKRRHREEIARRGEEVRRLEDTKRSNESTIRLWSKSCKDLKQEKIELQNDLNEQLGRVREYQANEEAYQRQEQFFKDEVKKNESLVTDNGRLNKLLSEYRGVSLDSPFRINFVCELMNLRSQQHDSALDACELLNLSDEQSFSLLWRVFIFCYEYFEERLVEIRQVLNMDASKALDMMFMARIQDHYKVMVDLTGLENAFARQFERELGSLVSEDRMVGYLRSCGELCWCVVLTTSPKLEFRPRVDDIAGCHGQDVPFDSSKFSDHTGNMRRGAGVVDQYVLPGLYRVDSDVAVALPCVRAHEVRAEKSRENRSDHEAERGALKSASHCVELDSLSEQLKPIEAVIVECRSYKVRQMLKKIGINLQKVDISIGCADDSCDYVFASNFGEFTRFARGCDHLVCDNNEEHVGAKIISIFPRV